MKTSSFQIEYLLQPKARQLLGHFSSLLHFRTTFYSLDGEVVCAGLDCPSSKYCQLLWTASEGQCDAQNRKMFKQVLLQNKCICYTCHGQLTEAILPVTLGDRTIGFIMIGQFRILGKNTFSISKDWNPKSPGFYRRLQQYYEKTPIYSQQQADSILQILQLMADYIITHYLITMKDFDLIQPLIDRIQNNPAETLTIQEAATSIGRSPSSLFQLFKTLTGKGFRQFQIECKLNEADRLLKIFPQIPIKEIAEQMGFTDPLYFSRLYRKYRGVSPSSQRLG
ncbi:MAG: PocR ligand-binding domain-containing protein [Kiritimatiellales bacterium]